jgi:hypothetical protein
MAPIAQNDSRDMLPTAKSRGLLRLRSVQPPTLAPDGGAPAECRGSRWGRAAMTKPYQELFSRTGEETAMWQYQRRLSSGSACIPIPEGRGLSRDMC